MFKTKQFKDLQSEWYQKLKEVGFEDIEKYNGELWAWHSFHFQHELTLKMMEKRAPYYYQATQMIHELLECPVFLSNTIDKIAWKLHAEGLSFREIAQQLNEDGFHTNKDYVGNIINKLKKWKRLPRSG